MEDEALAALLAIGDDIDADLLLLPQRHQRGVILRLAQRIASEAEGGAAAVGLRQPVGPRRAADTRRRKRSKLHFV